MGDELSTKKHSSKHKSKEEKHDKHKRHRDDPVRKHKKRRKHEDDAEEDGSHRKHKHRHREREEEKRRDKDGESKMEIVDDNPSDDHLWVEKDIALGGERVSRETNWLILF